MQSGAWHRMVELGTGPGTNKQVPMDWGPLTAHRPRLLPGRPLSSCPSLLTQTLHHLSWRDGGHADSAYWALLRACGAGLLGNFSVAFMGSWFPLGKQSSPLLTKGYDPPSGKNPHPGPGCESRGRHMLGTPWTSEQKMPRLLYCSYCLPACILWPQGHSSFHWTHWNHPSLPPRNAQMHRRALSV